MASARSNGILLVLLVAACSSRVAPPSPDGGSSARPPTDSTPNNPSANDASPSAPDDTPPPDPPGPPLDPSADPSTYSNPEEVILLMKGPTVTAFCTGTLVAPDVVITAGHCVDPSKFASYEVVAPTLASHPRVAASRAVPYDLLWDDPAHPDLGLVKLSAPIALGVYATLTDITSRVDGAIPTQGGTIVRLEEEPESRFIRIGPFSIVSAADDGYDHSYAVPKFSHAGDSGAGIFLVANGKQTHALVAVEHTPDPARGVDHVSRVDAAFIQWVQANGAAP